MFARSLVTRDGFRGDGFCIWKKILNLRSNPIDSSVAISAIISQDKKYNFDNGSFARKQRIIFERGVLRLSKITKYEASPVRFQAGIRYFIALGNAIIYLLHVKLTQTQHARARQLQ